MLLTISTTHEPATDLGYLLHKNPGNVRSVQLAVGAAHVFYPEAAPERCTAALLLEVDPIALVRGKKGKGEAFALAQYVNDRPYAASSMMSTAIAKLFGTAMSGRSDDRPELAEAELPLEARVPVLPCRGGEDLLRKLFEPLGYRVAASAIPLDQRFPQWGDSSYMDVRLSASLRLRDLLNHLYVLLPVLDDDKHYWVSRDEIEKLLAKGGDWLQAHPERELITDRYLRHQKQLAREALARLLEEDQAGVEETADSHDRAEAAMEEQVSLRDQRIGSVLAALHSSGAARVLDLGCGSGLLLRELLKEGGITEIVGFDVSARILGRAERRLRLDQMSPKQRERIRLIQGSLTYRDARLSGFDAAVVMEVIEHLDPARLGAFERTVFAEAKPQTVILTTPNLEYNVRFEGIATGSLRHRDHRFEWTREEFRDWATRVAGENRYAVQFMPVGEEDPGVGSPTQMAVFSL
ncbi:MAG: 3' terminal RNA ribose 2'-O-methyltransferase Hen1 [Actinomycetota bacterium]